MTDDDLIALYRATAVDARPQRLDNAILAAARRAAWWHRQSPLLVAAAACLGAALVAAQPVMRLPPARVVMSQDGLDAGRTTLFLRDTELMQQSAIRQMPGGSDGRSF